METQALTVTLEEAQKITRLGRDHLRTLIRENKLPNVGPRTRIRIPRLALEMYIAGGKS
jgi:excisionase family DNA binding protein